ncbi:MAG: amino acid adenylation domain-containing protein [Methylobacter sp.]
MAEVDWQNLRAANLLWEPVFLWAETTPDQVAIEEDDRSLTYGDLAQQVARVAGALAASGVVRQDRVLILIDNGIEACVAILGVMRANACYVPLSPGNPPLRLADIWRQAEPTAIITVAANLALLEQIVEEGNVRANALFVLDGNLSADSILCNAFGVVFGGSDILCAGPPPSVTAIDEDVAYILFTSGSTGHPKGVMVSHRAAKATIRWGCAYFRINQFDKLSNHSRLVFDVSVFDIFCALSSGATLCPLTQAGDLSFPGNFIRRHSITIWFSVPSVLGFMVQSREVSSGTFPTLRAVLLAGEPINPAWVSVWREHQAAIPLYNLYGPTEAAIVCSIHQIGVDSPFDGGVIPIGCANNNCELLILKEDAELMSNDNEIGRLFIAGTQLAEGYWRQPELTSKAFIRNPFKAEIAARMYDSGDLVMRSPDGQISFVGRRDSQVKVMGFRIELGEIEVALSQCSGVLEAAVIVHSTPAVIRAFVACDSTTHGSLESEIRAELELKIPKYMMPRDIVFLANLPHNQNGKIDRGALSDFRKT